MLAGAALVAVPVIAVLAPLLRPPTPTKLTQPTKPTPILPIEPPFAEGASGVVIGGPGVKGERLYREVHALDAKYHAVRHYSYEPPTSRDAFRRAALEAKAVVVVDIDSHDMARIYPEGLLAGDALYHGPGDKKQAPPQGPGDKEQAKQNEPLEIDLAREDVVPRAAALIYALALLAGPHPDFSSAGRASCPVPSDHSQLDQVAVLTLFAVPACHVIPVDSGRLSTLCSPPDGYKNEACALGHYRNPSSTPEVFERLLNEGPERFQPDVKLRLAETYCQHGSRHRASLKKAADIVRGFSESPDACRKMQLPGIAACIVTMSARPEPEAVDGPMLKVKAASGPEPEPVDGPMLKGLDTIELWPITSNGCRKRERARAIASRAFWWGQRGRFDAAATEYDQAYKISNEPAYALDLAEMWLHQGEPAAAKGVLDKTLALAQREHQIKAALLLWVAGQKEKQASWRNQARRELLALNEGHEKEAALPRGEDDKNLRALVCNQAKGAAPWRPARGAPATCLYELLLRPSSNEELRGALDRG